MAVRSYSGNAKTSAVSGTIAAAVTSIELADATGYPTGNDGPFVIAIDVGLANEEKVLVATRTGNTLTVASGGRGWDGTTAADHAAGAAVMHTFSATDAREANAHINDTTGNPHPQYRLAATAIAAAGVTYAGSTDLVATNVEAALDELDAEKISTTAANAAYVAKADAATATVTTSESTTTTFPGGDLATVGPSVTVTTGTRALVHFAAKLNNNTAGAGARVLLVVSGATTRAADTNEELYYAPPIANTPWRGGTTILLTGLTPGSNTFTLKYAINGGTATFSGRHLAVLPL